MEFGQIVAIVKRVVEVAGENYHKGMVGVCRGTVGGMGRGDRVGSLFGIVHARDYDDGGVCGRVDGFVIPALIKIRGNVFAMVILRGAEVDDIVEG